MAQAVDRSSQTLARAIDLLEALQDGPADLKGLQARAGLTRSTAHRLASLLTDRQLIVADGRRYRLGPGLIHLGFKAAERRDLITLARPILAALTAETDEATNLAIREGDEILYVAQAPGRRRIVVRHRVGDRNLVAATALGRAMMGDANTVSGCVFHLDDGGDRIRCIAAPIRDASGAIIAALSLSSIPQYMDEARMADLAPRVLAAAATISVELGYRVR